LIENFNIVIEILKAVRKSGVRIALDDFGTGYSSLAYLQRLPINTLKIDRCFIGEIAKDSRENSLIPTIIDLAHKLKLQVVGEGVETGSQLEKLLDDRCDYYQGYLLSKPLKADDVLPFLAYIGGTGVKNMNTDGFMRGVKNPELLNDHRVQEEIGRHRWIESEKRGYDIGFEKASVDWLNRFSDVWIKFNQPKTSSASATPQR